MTNWTNGPIFWMNQRADFGPLPVLACEPQRGGCWIASDAASQSDYRESPTSHVLSNYISTYCNCEG